MKWTNLNRNKKACNVRVDNWIQMIVTKINKNSIKMQLKKYP